MYIKCAVSAQCNASICTSLYTKCQLNRVSMIVEPTGKLLNKNYSKTSFTQNSTNPKSQVIQAGFDDLTSSFNSEINTMKKHQDLNVVVQYLMFVVFFHVEFSRQVFL